MIETNDKIVTIFGGSRCGENSPEYQQAKELGGRLAEAGFTICTGGYLGVMEAASRGAREKGGRVFGIVMNQFKIRTESLFNRQSCYQSFLRTITEFDRTLGRICRHSRRNGNGYGNLSGLEQTANRRN